MAKKYVLTHLYDTEEEAESARTSLMGKFGSLLENTKVVQAPYGFILEIDTKEIPENLFEEIKATIEPRAAPKIGRKPKKPSRPTRPEVTARPAAKPSESKPEPKPTIRAEPISPAPGTEKRKIPKRRRVAVVLAVFLGPWSWLYTYNKDKHKFWISLIVTVSIYVSVFLSAFSDYMWVLALVLFMWLISIWLWPIINAAARPREFYQEYPSVGTTWLEKPTFAGVAIGSIILFALLPTLLGTTPGSHTGTPGQIVDNPTLLWSPILEDDFSNPESGWYVGSDEYGESAYENGEYSLLAKKAVYPEFTLALDAGTHSDFAIEVDVRDMSRVSGTCAGVIFRYWIEDCEDGRGLLNYYLFYIRPSDGAYSIWRHLHSSEWTTLTNWTESNYIKRGSDTNHLKVVCRSAQIDVYANDQKLTTITDSSLTSGWVGVVVRAYEQPNAHYHFDNFKLYEANE